MNGKRYIAVTLHYKLLFSVRLFFRGGVSKGGKRHAVFFDRQNIWIPREIAAVAARVAELRYQADVGERRRGAEAIIAALWLRDDHLLQGRQAEIDPLLRPTVYLFLGLIVFLFP